MKRVILIIIFLIYSNCSFSATAFSTAETICYQQSCADPDATCHARVLQIPIPYGAPPLAYKIIPAGSGANSPWTGKPYFNCQSSANPCDLPEKWDQATQSCRLPCEIKNLGSITTQTHGFLTCKDGCSLDQTNNSVCVGISATGYCTANYRQNGNFCPDTSTQPTETTPPPPDDGGSGGGSTGGETGGTGVTGGETGGGETGGGETNPPDPEDPPLDGGGSLPPSGGSGSGLTQSQLDQTLGKHLGTISGGDDCESPPSCTASSSSICAASYQAWKLRCPHFQMNELGNGRLESSDFHKNINDRLNDVKNRYKQKAQDISNQLASKVQLSVSGGGSIACPTYTIKGVNIKGGICPLLEFFDHLNGLFVGIASVLAAYILLVRQ